MALADQAGWIVLESLHTILHSIHATTEQTTKRQHCSVLLAFTYAGIRWPWQTRPGGSSLLCLAGLHLCRYSIALAVQAGWIVLESLHTILHSIHATIEQTHQAAATIKTNVKTRAAAKVGD